jgi:hypothetical protein
MFVFNCHEAGSWESSFPILFRGLEKERAILTLQYECFFIIVIPQLHHLLRCTLTVHSQISSPPIIILSEYASSSRNRSLAARKKLRPRMATLRSTFEPAFSMRWVRLSISYR